MISFVYIITLMIANITGKNEGKKARVIGYWFDVCCIVKLDVVFLHLVCI